MVQFGQGSFLHLKFWTNRWAGSGGSEENKPSP